MSNFRQLTRTDPNSLWLKFSDYLQKRAWEQSQNHSNAAVRGNAHLNFLCLNAFVPWIKAWLEEEQPINLQIFQEDSLSSLWEFLNGIAIDIGETRLVLIPSETTDLEELYIPQEWIDIPSWKGDYYLAIQVNLEQQDCAWMRLWGFATHQDLKYRGEYDESDRAYSIHQNDLERNVNKMFSALAPAPASKKEENRESELQSKLIEELLARLGDASVYSPRLVAQSEDRFEQWEALLANPKWRDELYLRRIGQWFADRALPPLHQWFNINDSEIVEALRTAGWQRASEVFEPQETVALAWRFKSDAQAESISWVKQIDSESRVLKDPIALIVSLTRYAEQSIWLLPKLCLLPTFSSASVLMCDELVEEDCELVEEEGNISLPEGLTLTILQAGEIFDRVRARERDNSINLDEEFTDSLGEKFSLKITLDRVEIATFNLIV